MDRADHGASRSGAPRTQDLVTCSGPEADAMLHAYGPALARDGTRFHVTAPTTPTFPLLGLWTVDPVHGPLLMGHVVDRTGWHQGAWDGEPDHVAFGHAGLVCQAIRGRLGAWCEYVGVPAEGHPEAVDETALAVHGTITGGWEDPDGTAWFGFDCAHARDLVPGLPALVPAYAPDVYRDLAFVRAEARFLAEQLADHIARSTPTERR